MFSYTIKSKSKNYEILFLGAMMSQPTLKKRLFINIIVYFSMILYFGGMLIWLLDQKFKIHQKSILSKNTKNMGICILMKKFYKALREAHSISLTFINDD